MAWQEWNADTLALAKTEQRMVFLSIGYNACHCKLQGEGEGAID